MYVINRTFQLKYTVLLSLTGAAISAVFGGLMYMAHLDARRLAHADVTMLWLVVGATVMMGATLGLFGVVITHRVAGPIYVMSKHMQALAQGAFPRMRSLRKSDELKDFFDQFQAAVDRLREREMQDAAQLDSVLKVLGTSQASPDSRAALDVLRALRERKAAALEPAAPPAARA